MFRVLLWFVTATQLFAGEEFIFRSPETRVHLVELFSSEGCSSCPPAEEWFADIQKSSKLWIEYVPVAFHVDYWNRPWKDPFSSLENTARQGNYAKIWRSRSYTPCFAFNGKEWKVQKSEKIIPSSEQKGILEVKVQGEKIQVKFNPKSNEPKSFKAWFSFLTSEVTSNVRDGENMGRKLTHNFVSLGAHEQSMNFTASYWMSEFQLKQSKSAEAVAAWVTSSDSLEIEQSVGGWIKDYGK
jgi:hypothetical protein